MNTELADRADRRAFFSARYDAIAALLADSRVMGDDRRQDALLVAWQLWRDEPSATETALMRCARAGAKLARARARLDRRHAAAELEAAAEAAAGSAPTGGPQHWRIEDLPHHLREVARWTAQGRQFTEIAVIMELSPRTIQRRRGELRRALAALGAV